MGERKERRKEGTYVKRAIWWRDKISYGGLLHLSSKSKVVISNAPPELRWRQRKIKLQQTSLFYWSVVSISFRPESTAVPFQFDPLKIIVLHITIETQWKRFWPVHLFLKGNTWNFKIILETLLANNNFYDKVSELDTSVIRIFECCLICRFTWKKCLTGNIKFTYEELIERMAIDWSRVKPKLYTDISPYLRGCTWNRKNYILTIRLIIVLCFFLFLRKLTHIYCTKMYPMALMFLFPLSGSRTASLPHVFELSGPQVN